MRRGRPQPRSLLGPDSKGLNFPPESGLPLTRRHTAGTVPAHSRYFLISGEHFVDFERAGQFMAKKSVSRKVAPRPSRRQQDKDEGKARIEARLDPDVHARLAECAQRCGVSINQVVKDICEWAMSKVEFGEPVKHTDGQPMRSNPVPGVLWFGVKSQQLSREDARLLAESDGEPIEGYLEPTGGKLFFVLDYSKRTIRDA